MPPTSRKLATAHLEDPAMLALFEQISDDLGELRLGQARFEERIGLAGPDGKSGTGLTGVVLSLQAEVRGLMALKSFSRGLFIGLIVAVSVAVAGVEGAFKLLAGSAVLMGGTH